MLKVWPKIHIWPPQYFKVWPKVHIWPPNTPRIDQKFTFGPPILQSLTKNSHLAPQYSKVWPKVHIWPPQMLQILPNVHIWPPPILQGLTKSSHLAPPKKSFTLRHWRKLFLGCFYRNNISKISRLRRDFYIQFCLGGSCPPQAKSELACLSKAPTKPNLTKPNLPKISLT